MYFHASFLEKFLTSLFGDVIKTLCFRALKGIYINSLHLNVLKKLIHETTFCEFFQ